MFITYIHGRRLWIDKERKNLKKVLKHIVNIVFKPNINKNKKLTNSNKFDKRFVSFRFSFTKRKKITTNSLR